MTQEDKQLLLVDLCARLPYGVILQINKVITEKLHTIDNQRRTDNWFVNGFNIDFYEVKPYLRPMSSMTEEEKAELIIFNRYIGIFDWLNKNHFDYRDLISKGLALEAPEGMYGKEEQQ